MVANRHLPLLLIFASFFYAKGDFALPSDYQKCNVSDPNFNSCATVSFGKLVEMGVRGIPSLGIEPLDPIYIKEACFDSSGNNPVSMKLQMFNVTIYGFSKINIFSSDGTDLKTNNVIQMRGVIPEVRILANYTMTGNILSFSLSGFGTVEVFIYNFTLDYQTYHCPVMKNGKTYLTVRNITLDSEVQSGEVIYTADEHSSSFVGLSNADINTALNENFMAMYEEYKPTVNRIILSVISPKVVRFNNEVSFEDLFAK